MHRETTRKPSAPVKEPIIEPTDRRVVGINDSLRRMKVSLEGNKADPETILTELTSYATKQLDRNPDLKRDHVFSAHKSRIERRLLAREEV
jgi:hypothetical protein